MSKLDAKKASNVGMLTVEAQKNPASIQLGKIDGKMQKRRSDPEKIWIQMQTQVQIQ